MVVELCSGNELRNINQGAIIRKRSQAELSFLHVTLCIDLFYSPTKYH